MNLYVHFPFCRTKCSYCALLSRAGVSAERRAEYVARIVRELPRDEMFDTVYFGGGTPMMCDLGPLFETLRLADGAEFTVELHPLDVSDETLDALRRGGVNRISMGVQSFDDAVLKAMRRGCSAAEAVGAFGKVRSVFPNSGLDLIAGWPGVDERTWRDTVSQAIDLSPVHMSCYTLIREPKTQLDLAVRKGETSLPDDDAALAQIDIASEMFADAGLLRYEVSNYARMGFECRHNSAVWRGEDYLGLGEGAHGRIARTRTRGLPNGCETEIVTDEEDALERAVIGLRTARGIDLTEVAKRFPVLAGRIPGWRETLFALAQNGILRSPAPDVFVPTSRGFEVCDAVMSELM